MKNLGRNLSLLGNVCLIILLALAASWLWKTRRSHTDVLAASKRHEMVSKTYEAFINSSVYAATFVGRPFPIVELTDITGRTVSTDFSNGKGAIVILLSDKSCQPCLIAQLKSARRVHNALGQPEDLPIYAFFKAPLDHVKRLTRAFNLEYTLISDMDEVLVNEDLAPATPIVYLVNRDNVVTQCHIPSPGKPEFSILFFHQTLVNQLRDQLGLTLDKEKPDFGLSGTLYLDVITSDFDKSGVEELFY